MFSKITLLDIQITRSFISCFYTVQEIINSKVFNSFPFVICVTIDQRCNIVGNVGNVSTLMYSRKLYG